MQYRTYWTRFTNDCWCNANGFSWLWYHWPLGLDRHRSSVNGNDRQLPGLLNTGYQYRQEVNNKSMPLFGVAFCLTPLGDFCPIPKFSPSGSKRLIAVGTEDWKLLCRWFDSAPGNQETPKPPSDDFFICEFVLECFLYDKRRTLSENI